MEALNDISSFVKAFQNKKLKTLKVSINKIVLTPRENWSWIVDLLDNNPGLEKIKIKLTYSAQEKSEFLYYQIPSLKEFKYCKDLNDKYEKLSVENELERKQLIYDLKTKSY